MTGAVTLIQRFGSALNLNVHFHLLVLDGVYRRDGEGRLVFVPVPSPLVTRAPSHHGGPPMHIESFMAIGDVFLSPEISCDVR